MTLCQLHLSTIISPAKVIKGSDHFQTEWKALYLNSFIYSFQCVRCLIDSFLVKHLENQKVIANPWSHCAKNWSWLWGSHCYHKVIASLMSWENAKPYQQFHRRKRMWKITLQLLLIQFPAAQWAVPYNFLPKRSGFSILRTSGIRYLTLYLYCITLEILDCKELIQGKFTGRMLSVWVELKITQSKDISPGFATN